MDSMGSSFDLRQPLQGVGIKSDLVPDGMLAGIMELFLKPTSNAEAESGLSPSGSLTTGLNP